MVDVTGEKHCNRPLEYDGFYLSKKSGAVHVEIQHKAPFLADKGAIEHVLAQPDNVVPFDRTNVPRRSRGPI